MKRLKQSGHRILDKEPAEVLDRLRLAMSAANFTILSDSETSISFRHGTFITQTASHFPKHGLIEVSVINDETWLSYEIEPDGFPTWWLLVFGILTCWLIFPAIIIHRILVYHPKQLMENLLRGI